MTQNIYDDPTFFDGYSQLPRSLRGLEAAVEWPTIQAMLPALTGLRVVDLGCGYGWFCRWASAQGAAQVLGLDVSERMLTRARQTTPANLAITYIRADLETLALPEAAFELAYSSLALHYVEDLAGVLATLHRALVPGGRLVFSLEHPIFMAPSHPDWANDAQGNRAWPLNHYAIEGPRTTRWLTEGVVKQHRTLSTTLNLLIRHGFTLTQIEEWAPTEAQVAENPELSKEWDRPTFLLVSTQRQ